MKEYASDKIRNVAVLSHDGAGKTAVVEGLLLACGAVDAVGIGQNNKHILDFEPEEIKRNVTIQLGIAPCEWNGYKLNFLDTPGYSEFCGEVRSALRASDGMLLVVSAESGVEMDTIRSWDYAVELQMPRMVFINKMDMENADFFGTLETMRRLFGKAIMPLQIPIGEGAEFRGIIDVAKMCAYEWKDGVCQDIPVPEEYKERALEIRELCVEAAAEGDDELLLKYLVGEELDIEEIRRGLRQGMVSGKVCPVMCGSARQQIGLDKVLDRIIRYMPDATKRVMTAENTQTGETEIVHYNRPFSAFVFKTMVDPYAGKLSYVRIFSGELSEGDKLYNTTKETEEKMGKMFTLIGKQQIPITKAIAGDIIVIPKLTYAQTGDTFADPAFPIQYRQIRFPQPLHTVALVPEKKGEEEKLTSALMKIHEEDPTCVVEKSIEGRQLLLHCMGDVHLEHILAKMERKYGVKGKLEKPYIPYRETIRSMAKAEGKHKKQSGGHGQYGHVWLQIEPLQDGREFEFVDAIFGGAVPRQYIPAVEKGVRETLEKGLLAGYPMINVKVTLQDGSYHSVDSSELAFKVAAAQALKKGVPYAQPILLEPVYTVNVIVPEEFMGDIMGDFSGKRGRILGMDHGSEREGLIIIHAQVPLAEMDGYVTQLRSMTQGRGTFNMEFYAYEEVPKKIAEPIIAAHQDGTEE